jgi:hypothetical protein
MKVKDDVLVAVHTAQRRVNINNYNSSYFCVTLLEQFKETAGKCYTQGKSVNMNCVVLKDFFFVVLRPTAGHGLLILEVPTSHTTTHHIR